MLKDLGITAFGGINENMNYYGGELEFVPLRATLFGKKDFLDLGVVAGAATLDKKPEDKEFKSI